MAEVTRTLRYRAGFADKVVGQVIETSPEKTGSPSEPRSLQQTPLLDPGRFQEGGGPSCHGGLAGRGGKGIYSVKHALIQFWT